MSVSFPWKEFHEDHEIEDRHQDAMAITIGFRLNLIRSVDDRQQPSHLRISAGPAPSRKLTFLRLLFPDGFPGMVYEDISRTAHGPRRQDGAARPPDVIDQDRQILRTIVDIDPQGISSAIALCTKGSSPIARTSSGKGFNHQRHRWSLPGISGLQGRGTSSAMIFPASMIPTLPHNASPPPCNGSSGISSWHSLRSTS